MWFTLSKWSLLLLLFSSCSFTTASNVRLFVERGAALPDGKTGVAVVLYGVRTLKNGSEKVVWSRVIDYAEDSYDSMAEILEASWRQAMMAFDDGVVYLFYRGGKRTDEFLMFKISISDGELLLSPAIVSLPFPFSDRLEGATTDKERRWEKVIRKLDIFFVNLLTRPAYNSPEKVSIYRIPSVPRADQNRYPVSRVQLNVTDEIQVRVRKREGRIYIYGMRVLSDGSEEVVWSRMVEVSSEHPELRIFYLDSETFYLVVKGEYVEKISRDTGNVAERFLWEQGGEKWFEDTGKKYRFLSNF